MNWPLVPRSVHKEFLASAEARARAEHENAQQLRRDLADANARADQERAERLMEQDAAQRRYDALMDRFVAALTPTLPNPSTGMVPYVERELQSEEDKAIAKVIREQSDGNAALGRELRAYARELKRQGLTADEIIGKLVEVWSSESVGQVS